MELTSGNASDGVRLISVQGAVGTAFSDVMVGCRFAPTLIRAGAGNDNLTGGQWNSTLFGEDGDDTIIGDSGLAYLRGDDGDDSIIGGSGFDDINGNKGNDTARGGLGDDWVVGGQANDLIRGGQSDDLIYGEDGNDWPSGDRGNDTLTGGQGADTFHTWPEAGIDRVLDFSVAQGDRVQVDLGCIYTVSQVGADTVIDFGSGNQMILVGVTASSLTGNWIFFQ